jgi:hypothetical protein
LTIKNSFSPGFQPGIMPGVSTYRAVQICGATSFRHHEGAVDKALRQIEFASTSQILG